MLAARQERRKRAHGMLADAELRLLARVQTAHGIDGHEREARQRGDRRVSKKKRRRCHYLNEREKMV